MGEKKERKKSATVFVNFFVTADTVQCLILFFLFVLFCLIRYSRYKCITVSLSYTRHVKSYNLFNKKPLMLLVIITVTLLGSHKARISIYRVIHKSVRDVRPLRYSSRDGHAEGEHVNRGRETPNFCPTLQVLICCFLLCLSWLLCSRVRKFRRDL
jgi:hypothetical protein